VIRVAFFFFFYFCFFLIEPTGDFLTLIKTIDRFGLNGTNFMDYRESFSEVRDIQFLFLAHFLGFITTKLWLDVLASVLLSSIAWRLKRNYGVFFGFLLTLAFFWPPLYVDLWRQFTAIALFLVSRKFFPFLVHVVTATYLGISILPKYLRIGTLVALVFFTTTYSSSNHEKIGLVQIIVMYGVFPLFALMVPRQLRYIYFFPIFFYYLGETWLAERFFITSMCILPISITIKYKPVVVIFGLVTLMYRLI
jgi:hypothetical protein